MKQPVAVSRCSVSAIQSHSHKADQSTCGYDVQQPVYLVMLRDSLGISLPCPFISECDMSNGMSHWSAENGSSQGFDF